VVCLIGVSQGEKKCGSEIKLLLLPTELHASLESFNAKRAAVGSVYFFDTDNLELLSEGVILRLRSGTTSDLTVKLRLPNKVEANEEFGWAEHYTCEVDFTGELRCAPFRFGPNSLTTFLRRGKNSSHCLVRHKSNCSNRLMSGSTGLG
jgi:hypothetical protein